MQSNTIELMLLDPVPGPGSEQNDEEDMSTTERGSTALAAELGKNTEVVRPQEQSGEKRKDGVADSPAGGPSISHGFVDRDKRYGNKLYSEYFLGSDTRHEIQRMHIEPDRKGWAGLVDMYRVYDESRIKDAKEDVDTLLVFAGLFSAVLSAFVIETYPKLQEDSGDKTNSILMQMSIQLASLSITNSFINSTQPSYNASNTFSPPSPFVRINTLWSCSLIISLITASFGILVKQWLHEFMAQDTQDPKFRIRVRFFRSEGLDKWQVFQIAAGLPMLLQIALILFFIGFSEFLILLHPIVGWISAGIIMAWAVIFLFTTLAPVWSSQCPYKTPMLKGLLDFLRSRLSPTIQALIRICRFPLLVYHVFRVIVVWLFSLSELFPPRDLSSHEPLYQDQPWYRYLKIKLHNEYQNLKSFEFRQSPPEEKDIGEAADSDLSIMTFSKTLFRDEQIERTIGECSQGSTVTDILDNYRQTIKALGDPENDTIPWKFQSGSQSEIDGVFIMMLSHKCQYPDPRTQPIPELLDSIIGAEGSSKWKLFPDIIVRLIQLDVDYQASLTFLTIYRAIYRGSLKTLLRWELGGPQYIEHILELIRLILDYFSHRTSSLNVFSSHIRSLIEEFEIEPDVFVLYRTCDILLSLASPQTLERYHTEREEHEKLIFENAIDWVGNWMHGNNLSGLTFLAFYSLLAIRKGPMHDRLSQCFKRSPIQGDSQCLENIIEATKQVSSVFWNPTFPQTLLHFRIRATMLQRGVRPDIGLLYQTFDMFTSLADEESQATCQGSIKKLREEIWEDILGNQVTFPTDEYFVKRIHSNIECGAQSPFLALYSASIQGSFNHFEMFLNFHPQEGSLQYLNNLISIANLLMDIWPLDILNPPSGDGYLQELVARHGITKDVGAFCYTFSILLWLAPNEAIAERKEEVKEVSSRVLQILSLEGDWEFIMHATRTTYMQLYWSWWILNYSRYWGVVDEGLTSKLKELRDSVNSGHDYNPEE